MEKRTVVVQKFGGSSVANVEKIRRVAEYIKKTVEEGKRVIVVVSAMGKDTDYLLDLAKEVCDGGPVSLSELDKLLATGEERSAPLLALALNAKGVPAVSLRGVQIRLTADDVRRKIKGIQNPEKVEAVIRSGKVAVVTGYQGVCEGTEDKVVTLGRGGSDLTAIALAAVFSNLPCEIYTDVDGVYAIDPRLVERAKRFAVIPYIQMLKLAQAGASVLMPRSVVLANNLGVEIRVLLSPSIGESNGGTLVYSGSTLDEMETFFTHMAIGVRHLSLIEVNNLANQAELVSEIFEALKEINIEDTAQSFYRDKISLSILCSQNDAKQVLSEIEELKRKEDFNGIQINREIRVSRFTLVSPAMIEGAGYLARVCRALAEARISPKMITTSSDSISIVVEEAAVKKVAEFLAQEFYLVA